MCFLKQDIKNQDEFNRTIDYLELDESLWNDKCDYLLPESCMNINPNNYNMVIMQLNIRSVLAKQSDLNQLLSTLAKKNSSVDILLLCETFLKEGITYKRRYDLDIFFEKDTESMFIEIAATNGKCIILGSMYHPPNTANDHFNESLIDIVKKIKKKKKKQRKL